MTAFYLLDLPFQARNKEGTAQNHSCELRLMHIMSYLATIISDIR